MSRFTLSKAKQLLATTLALLAGPFVPQVDIRAERSAKAGISGARPPWWLGAIRTRAEAPKYCLQCGAKSGRYTFCSVDHHHLWNDAHPNQGKQPMLLTRRQHRWALAHRMPGGVLMRPWQVIAALAKPVQPAFGEAFGAAMFPWDNDWWTLKGSIVTGLDPVGGPDVSCRS